MLAGTPNSPLNLCSLFSLACTSKKSQETLKNLSKALEEHLERDSGHCPSGKLDIDFIALWDDPMQDDSITIINIFELFTQTALIGADKICAGSDDCRE